MVIDYLKKLTFLTKEEILKIEAIHKEKPEQRVAHKRLAEEVITFLHGHEEYLKAVRISESLFSEKVKNLSSEEVMTSLKGVPIVEVSLDKTIVDMLVDSKIVASKREAREFVLAGAISINNQKITDLEYVVSDEDTIDNKVMIIKRGKKNYYLGIVNK